MQKVRPSTRVTVSDVGSLGDPLKAQACVIFHPPSVTRSISRSRCILTTHNPVRARPSRLVMHRASAYWHGFDRRAEIPHRAALERTPIDRDVFSHHSMSGEPLLDHRPAAGSIKPMDMSQSSLERAEIVTQVARLTFIDDFGGRATIVHHDRSTTRQGFDHYHTKRLRPSNRTEQADGILREGRTSRFDSVRRRTRCSPPRCGATRAVKYSRSAGSDILAAIRNGIPVARAAAIASSMPLSGCILPRNAAYPPLPAPNGIRSTSMPWWMTAAIDTPVAVEAWWLRDRDHRRSFGDGPVDGRQDVVERSVIGGHDGRTCNPLGIERAHHRVVMNDVDVRQHFVGSDHVARLFGDAPVAHSKRLGEHPLPRHRTGGVAGRDEHDIDSGCSQAPRENVEDVFGASVGRRRHGQPRRSNDADAHGWLAPGTQDLGARP